MRLISLEIQGFKSFPDKTVLKFAPGVTTVVGPNGSGKSNISDAVRWVLGEISSKNMRGSKMEDVVFAGTDKRKPMSFAEVSLTLDNREEAGFSRLQSEYDEVTITRRYNRNGTSDYMINRRPVRLKDINTLFMNTGIGRDGYSIVSQGKAAEIISQKSDERRNVFEEAAGVSKYRYQKNDAEKKLAETSLNCERLADILLEKKNILAKLEKDAERAKRFLEVYEKKKEADVSLAVYDIAGIRVKLDEKGAKAQVTASALTQADNEISDATDEYERLELQRNRAKENASALTSRIEEISSSRYAQDTNAKVFENDLKHLEEHIGQTEQNLVVFNENLAEYTETAEKASDAFCAATEKLSEAEANEKELERVIEAIKGDISALDIEIEHEMEELSRFAERQDEIRMRLAELEGSASSTSDRKAELQKELDETKRSTSSIEEGMKRYKVRMDDYTAKSDKIKEADEAINAEAEALRREIEDLNQKIVNYASDIRDIRTRIDSLRRMEELFEGYPHSVSAIMNASKAGNLKGIIGPLSHVFSVNPKYALAIEIALGSNVQNIVCEDDRAAKNAIVWLKNNGAGRSTFYPLNTMTVAPLPVDERALRDYAGYKGVASDLITFEPRFSRVMKSLLGRTFIFDNLDNANIASEAFGRKLRIVTLDGQIINATGSFTGGTAKQSGVLNRTNNIERLNADRLKVEAEKKIAEEKFAQATEKLEKLNAHAQESANKLKLLSTLYQADLTHYTTFETQMKTVEETIAKLTEQICDVDSFNTRIEAEKLELSDEQARISESIRQSEAVRQKKSSEKAILRANAEVKTDECNKALIAIAGLAKDVEAAQRELEMRVDIMNRCKESIERANETIADDTRKLTEKREKIAKAVDMAEKLSEDIRKMSEERDLCDRQATELELKLSALNKSITEKMSSREMLSNDKTKLEAQIETLTQELDRLVAYLTTEYEMTFTEAQALDYPPVTAENRSAISQTLQELKNKLRNIGSVDPNSIEEFRLAKETYEEMSVQYDDLTKSREEFANTVELLEKEMRTRFVEVMGEINTAFQRVFRELFGGGNAELVLTDPEDVLHCGIEINVAPPGKIIKNLSLLSGGEQAFISIALFFAILNVNPSPFCIFDEVEAALDEVNVAMFANYIKKYSDKTQFITITHRRGTMEVADTLYGVTMAERGISRVLTLNVNEVESKLGVKL